MKELQRVKARLVSALLGSFMAWTAAAADSRPNILMRGYFELCFGKRPAEELYDLKIDPEHLKNVAGQPEYRAAQEELQAQLDRWMRESADPRATRDDDHWDAYPYFSPSF